MEKYQLAQINIAIIKGENMDEPIMKDFMDQLDNVYAEADHSPGFVWRLEEDPNAPEADPKKLINISVWNDVEALKNFTFKNIHGKLLKRRKEWFIHLKETYSALWWIESGDFPNTKEALDRLIHLKVKGPSAKAFGFKNTLYHTPQLTKIIKSKM